MKDSTLGKKLLFGTAVLAAAGILLASNQGVAINFSLLGPADSASGTNWVGLPYRTPPSLQTAADLFDNLGGATDVTSVSRFDPTTNTFQVYDGNAPDDFNLVPGEGIRLIMKTTMSFRILGSHDPTAVVSLLGPADSVDGSNWYAHPYNAGSTTAGQLVGEIGTQNVNALLRFLPASDNLITYTGSPTDQNFTLVAGEAYKIEMARSLQFVPRTRP